MQCEMTRPSRASIDELHLALTRLKPQLPTLSESQRRCLEPLFAHLHGEALSPERSAHVAVTEKTLALIAEGPAPALVFKGAALAQALYPVAELRSHEDVDLWVDAADFDRWSEWLNERGFATVPNAFSHEVMPERSFRRAIGHRAQALVDLHAAPNCRPALRNRLDFASSHAEAMPYRGVVRFVLGGDALLLAVMHRWGHHRNQAPRAIWLLDQHLLWTTLDLDARRKLIAKAQRRGLYGLLRASLLEARQLYGTRLEPALPEAACAWSDQLLTRRSAMADFWFDLCSWPSVRAQAAFLRAHLFPDRQYLLWRFGPPLWWAWCRRTGTALAHLKG